MGRLSERVVDLTHPLHPRMPVAIGAPRLMLARYLDMDAGDVANVEVIQISLHTGTHVDAPGHFVPGGATVDALDPLALCGPAVVVDVAGTDEWVAVRPDDLLAWEGRTGEQVREGDIVILRTGHARWWSDLPGGSVYMVRPWPWVTAELSDLLVERGIRALGVECPDPDRVDQRDLAAATFETHRRLLGAGIPIIENLADLDRIPVTRFELMALALPVQGAFGSPIRALAIIPV